MAGTYTSVTLSVDVTGEKADVLTLLEDQRAMFLVTLRDLDDEQARRRSTVSELTLGGLLKHLTMVQREHTQTILDRDPNAEIHMDNLEHGYELTDGETFEEWLAAYRDAALAYDAVIAEVGSLDELIPQATAPCSPSESGGRYARWPCTCCARPPITVATPTSSARRSTAGRRWPRSSISAIRPEVGAASVGVHRDESDACYVGVVRSGGFPDQPTESARTRLPAQSRSQYLWLGEHTTTDPCGDRAGHGRS